MQLIINYKDIATISNEMGATSTRLSLQPVACRKADVGRLASARLATARLSFSKATSFSSSIRMLEEILAGEELKIRILNLTIAQPPGDGRIYSDRGLIRSLTWNMRR
jgi:hypothetical protein